MFNLELGQDLIETVMVLTMKQSLEEKSLDEPLTCEVTFSVA